MLPLAFTLIGWAQAVTPFEVVSKRLLGLKQVGYFFVDTWVLAHLAIAVATWALISTTSTGFLPWLCVVYGGVRVLELTLYNIDVMLGDPTTSEPYKIRSLRRSLLLGIVNYAEVLFWFSAFYRFGATFFGTNAELVSSATGSFYFSILTMATYGDITPNAPFARWLVAFHLILSLFLTLGVLARFVSVLPRPKSHDPND